MFIETTPGLSIYGNSSVVANSACPLLGRHYTPTASSAPRRLRQLPRARLRGNFQESHRSTRRPRGSIEGSGERPHSRDEADRCSIARNAWAVPKPFGISRHRQVLNFRQRGTPGTSHKVRVTALDQSRSGDRTGMIACAASHAGATGTAREVSTAMCHGRP